MKDRKNILLLLASVLCGLVLGEAGLRWFMRHQPRSGQAPVTSSVMEYARGIRLAPGTDLNWFSEDPPPLPNRTPPSADRVSRFQEFRRRGLYAAQSEYIWNYYYIERERCNPNGLLRNFPEDLLVFTPPVPDSHPRYWFPPNESLPSGLVTNAFGFRGHPIALVKPPRTIRIAFLGASTTVGFHEFPFSYPEYVEHWLNRFAEANHYDVRFEALNTGREGFSSPDLADVMHHEVRALDPDVAVYYEGSNQFSAATRLLSPQFPTRTEVDPRDKIVQHKLPAWLIAHFATANLLDRLLMGAQRIGEPVKPSYRLIWPAEVNEKNPDPDNPHLPLSLPQIAKDLDSIRNDLNSAGARLVLCSFKWFADDGIGFSPTRHEQIYKHLNTYLWPLRYSDIRRLADFQNRFFRNYATAREIGFVDVASAVPEDPDLFVDGIHMTEGGDRLRAWIFFQRFVPWLRPLLDSHQLPRPPASSPLPPPWRVTTTRVSSGCAAPTGPLTVVPGGLSLDEIRLDYQGGVLENGPPLKLTTRKEQWNFSARIPFHVPPDGNPPLFALVRARVLSGRIGIGVHDRETRDFQSETLADPAPAIKDIFVPVVLPDRADFLILRNVAPGGVPTTLSIESVSLVAPATRDAAHFAVQ
jgi:hypothetical protein